jgi:hypothetical protein
MVVVPWGFGKWLGRRGVLITELISEPPCAFFLGDNGGRLAGWPEPKLYEKARASGIKILPGTDPFPFRWDQSRVGRFGMELEGSLSCETPLGDLKELVNQLDGQPAPYGCLTGGLDFVRNQVAIQLRSVMAK